MTLADQDWKAAFRFLFLVVLLVAIVWFVHKIAWVIGLVLISLLIVYSISPLSSFLHKKGIPHFLSVLIVYFALIFAVILIFYLVLPTLIIELSALARYLATDYSFVLPQLVRHLDDILQHSNFMEALQNIAADLPHLLQQAVNTATTVTVNLLSGLSEAVIVLFLVFYLLRDLDQLKKGVIRLFPARWRKEVTHIMEIIDLKVGAYLRGNMVRCAIVGILTGSALAVAGMPFALLLGILAGLLNIIVYVGPYLAGVPALALALTPDTPGVLLIIIIYVAVQAIDAFLLVPVLLGKAVDLKPFTIIVSLLIGGKLLGLIGVILAIPVAAALKVIICHYHLKEENRLKI